MANAFDQVRYNFLFTILTRFGFGEEFFVDVTVVAREIETRIF
jgi:hypothetical protein